MTRVLKKIHIYIGLINFAMIFVWGIAGLSATSHAGLGPPPFGAPEYKSFSAPSGATDQQVALLVHQLLQPPLAPPVPNFAIKRNRDGHLELDFYSINGMQRATVLEQENRIRVETRRVSLAQFINHAHATTPGDRIRDWRILAWGYYSELTIWSLLFMAASGIYLWLASRPRLRWAQWTFAGGNIIFATLYLVTR